MTPAKPTFISITHIYAGENPIHIVGENGEILVKVGNITDDSVAHEFTQLLAQKDRTTVKLALILGTLKSLSDALKALPATDGRVIGLITFIDKIEKLLENTMDDEPPFGPSVGGFLADNGLLPSQVNAELKRLKEERDEARYIAEELHSRLNKKDMLYDGEQQLPWQEDNT